MVPSRGRSVAVVGGGAVGLIAALAAVDAGWSVTVYDAGRERRAAQVAGGMLASLGEAHPGEDALLAASAQSVSRWPKLLRRLGDDDILTARDTLLVAGSPADRAQLDEAMVFAAATVGGDAAQVCDGPALRAAEPSLARLPAGGYLVPGEGAVDNRKLIAALYRELKALGVQVISTRVTDLAEVSGDQVLVAAGVDSAALVPGGLPQLRGEKGEILRLARSSWSVAPPSRVIRARWHGRNCYLVPRADGLVLGATQYEAVDLEDRAPQVGGVADLLADACELFPGLRTYELTEVAAGIRPMSTDGLPLVRRIDERVVVAAGHGRNGIALAPGTAAQVVELLAGEEGAAQEGAVQEHSAESMERMGS